MTKTGPILIALLASNCAHAADCDNQSYPTTICLAFEPITGDPVADRCEIARLEASKMRSEFDPNRVRTVADIPLPSHTVMMQMLAESEAHVEQECQANQ